MIFTVGSLALSVPKATSEFYVNDFANVMSSETKAFILKCSVELQSKTGAQIVVTTVKDMGGAVLEEYSLSMLRTYGIGDKQKNNGVLILLAMNERKSRIEVGYGLEGALPDGKTGRIQDENILPLYKQNNYDEGLKNGYVAILNEVLKEYNVTLTGEVPQAKSYATTNKNTTDNIPPFVKVIFAVFIIILLLIDWIFLGGTITRTLFWIALAFGRGGGRGGGGGFGGFSGGGGSGGGGGSSRGF